MLDKLQSCAWHPIELWLWRFPFRLFCIVRPEEYPTRQDSCVTLETSSYPWIICPALLLFSGAFSYSGFFIPLQQPNWKIQISHARAGLAVCPKPEFSHLFLLPYHCSLPETAIIAIVWKNILSCFWRVASKWGTILLGPGTGTNYLRWL